MRKLPERKRGQVDDRTRLVVYCTVTLASFLLASLLPLAFYRGKTVAESSMTVAQRAALFDAYWNHGGEGCSVEPLTSLGKSALDYCSERMDELLEEYIIDRRRLSTNSEGNEYFTVYNESGQIRLCRMWAAFQGDWDNWMDVCFDIDGGDIYYLYVKSECTGNYEDYANALDPDINADTVADTFAQRYDYQLQYLSRSGSAEEGGVIAVFTGNGSAICIDISCTYYESSLFEMKLRCI